MYIESKIKAKVEETTKKYHIFPKNPRELLYVMQIPMEFQISWNPQTVLEERLIDRFKYYTLQPF